MATNKLYFKNLDSIRFIAALMVFLSHSIRNSFDYLSIKGTYFEKLLNVVSDGHIGVSIFFVLSGFLITYLLISEYESNLKISLKNFYIRRVLRIWPLYFMIVFFSFVLYPWLKSLLGINNPLGSNVLYYLTFLSNFDEINIEKNCFGSNAMSQNITWSVSVEEQFYLFWPLLFVFLPKRYWIFTILLLIFGSTCFRILHHKDSIVLYFHTLSVLVDLAIGGLMAYLLKYKARIRSFFENCSTTEHLILFLFSFLLIFFEDNLFSFKYGEAIGRVFISLSFGLIISAQAFSKTDSFFDLKNWKFADRWGKYTYGIYLIHPIVLTLLDVIVRVLHLSKDNFATILIFGLVAFIITLFLSKFSFKYYESKFLALKDKFQ